MKAMLVNESQNLVWSDVDTPAIKPEQVLIKVYAAALNRADLLQREGRYPSTPDCPPWPGLEISGRITECGDKVTKFKVGDKVCALLGGGGYAEYVAANEGMVMPIPSDITYEEASALPEAFATCYLNLFIEGRFKRGETLFFPAGASGLASVGIPMAKAFGAFVITSVLNGEIKEKIKHLGADVIINAETDDTVEIIKTLAENGRPIDIAIDCLAGETVGKIFPYVNDGCRWIIISTLAGIETTVPLRALLTKGIDFKGSMLRKRSVEEKSTIIDRLVRDVWPKIEKGELRPTVYKTLPIVEAEIAHDILKCGENIGKVVLKICDEQE